MNIGLTLILIGTCFHVVFLLPRKHSSASVHEFYLSLTGSGLVASLALGVLMSMTAWNTEIKINSVKSFFAGTGLGIIWAVASFSYLTGTDLIGLSRSTAIKNLTAVFGLVLGICFLGEYNLSNPMVTFLTTAGCLIMVVATAALAQTLPGSKGQIKLRGVLSSLFSALIFAVYAAAVKLVSPSLIDILAVPLFTALGGFISAGVLLIAQDKPWHQIKKWLSLPLKEHLLAGLSGILWLFGTFCVTSGLSMSRMGISWSLIPFGTLLSVILGIWLHEIDPVRQKWKLIIGITGSLGAMALLFLIAGFE